MKNILTLFKLNIKLNRNEKEKNELASLIFSTIIYGVMISFIVMFFTNLVVNFENFGAEFELLIFLLFFVLIAKVAFGIALSIKVFFGNSQNGILAKLPFTSFEIFTSKWIYIFTVQLIFGLAILVPLLNIYGIMLGMQAPFFVAIPFVIIASSLVSVFLSTLLSFPFAFLKTFLSNKFALMLLIISATLALGFYGYMRIINSVTNITNDIEFTINNDIIEAIARLSTLLSPNVWLGNILFFQDILQSIIRLTIFLVILTAITMFLIKFAYEAMLKKKVGEEKDFVKVATSNQKINLYSSLIKREFNSTFRNTSFLFQYFAILLIVPLITYLTVSSTAEIASGSVGDVMQETIAFMVLGLFTVVSSSSFTSNAISRETSGFYLFKITPIKPRDLITSKLIFSALGTFFSLLVTVIILMLFGFLSVSSMFILFAFCFIFSIGNICYSMKMDLDSPQLQDDMALAQTENKSVIAIARGLFMVIVMSAIMLINVAFDYEILIYSVVGLAMIYYATSGFLALYVNLDKKFKEITV